MTHQNTATKEKVDKLDFIKIKASVLQKTLSRESKKDISQNGRKYLQIISDKDFLPRIYKELLQLSHKKTTQFFKWAKDLNRHFSQEDIQMANKHMKKMLNIISHQRITNQNTTMRCQFTPARMAIIITKWKLTSVGDEVEELEPSHIAGGNVKWCSHFGKQSGSSSKS